MENTKQAAAVAISLAVAEAIRALGSVPNGHLYARLMDRMSIETYNAIIGALVGAGLISKSSDLLTWIGPRF